MQDMIDSSPIASEMMRALRQDLGELMNKYMYRPNTEDTRDALAISVQSQLDHFATMDRSMEGSRVESVEVIDDGTAIVNVSYRRPVNTIEVSMNLAE